MRGIGDFFQRAIFGGGLLSDNPDDVLSGYVPPEVSATLSPDEKQAYAQQIKDSLAANFFSKTANKVANTQNLVNQNIETRLDLQKAGREQDALTAQQTQLGQIFGAGMTPQQALMDGGGPTQANALKMQGQPTRDNRTKAAQYRAAAQYMAQTGNSEAAKRYADIAKDLDPLPPSEIQGLEYLTGQNLAGSGATGFGLLKDYKRAGATNVTQSLNNTPEGKGFVTLIEGYAKELPALQAQATGAERANETLKSLITTGEKGTFSGALAPGAVGAAQFLRSLGVDLAPELLANTRTFEAGVNQLVLDFMATNGGARGFTEKETQMLLDAFPKLIDSPAARRSIANMLLARNNRLIAEYNAARTQFSQFIKQPLDFLPNPQPGALPAAPSKSLDDIFGN